MMANFAAFYCGWFACVLGAAHGWVTAGTAIAAMIVAVHVSFALRPLEELKLAVITVVIGAAWDSSLMSLGWLSFASGTMIEGFAPHWILAMYALFAMTLNVSLDWLKGRWMITAVLGAVSGPLSYWAGARLGAVIFVNPDSALAALAAGWAVMLPVLVALSCRYNGIAPVSRKSAA